MQSHWELGLQHMNLVETQLNINQFKFISTSYNNIIKNNRKMNVLIRLIKFCGENCLYLFKMKL